MRNIRLKLNKILLGLLILLPAQCWSCGAVVYVPNISHGYRAVDLQAIAQGRKIINTQALLLAPGKEFAFSKEVAVKIDLSKHRFRKVSVYDSHVTNSLYKKPTRSKPILVTSFRPAQHGTFFRFRVKLNSLGSFHYQVVRYTIVAETDDAVYVQNHAKALCIPIYG